MNGRERRPPLLQVFSPVPCLITQALPRPLNKEWIKRHTPTGLPTTRTLLLEHLSPTSVRPSVCRLSVHPCCQTVCLFSTPLIHSAVCFFFPASSLSLPSLTFQKVVSIPSSRSQTLSTLSVLCVPSLSVLCNRSYFHPCLSVTVAAGWLNIYIFHSLVTFPSCRSGTSSLLAARLLTDYCLKISYGHSKWYTGIQGERLQRLEGGGRDRGRSD